MKKRKQYFALMILVFCVLLIVANIAGGQVRNYKENEKINVGINEQIKIIRCKGEGTDMQCEVVHFIQNTQVGNSFWLTAKAIQKNERPIKTTEKANPLVKAKSNIVKKKPNIPVNKSTIVKAKLMENPREVAPQAQPKAPNDFARRLSQATSNSQSQKPRDSLAKNSFGKVDSVGKQ